MQKNSQSGLTIVYFGDGKGKTTAALGLILRASGYNLKIALIKFIKAVPSGEDKAIVNYFKNVHLERLGLGFVGILGDKKPFLEHKKMARKALAKSEKVLKSRQYDIVILDEILSAVQGKLISVKDLLKLLEKKPRELDLILTGRSLPKSLVSKADLITEMKKIKHPFEKGFLAKRGIDF